jgi:epoxyqueuosine reductase
MTTAAAQSAAANHGITLYGGFHGGPDDGLPEHHQTLLMFGPAANFWYHFQSTPESQDKRPNPIDRWSTRIFTELAAGLNATPFLPFGGPPYAPFLGWALKTGRAWSSPLGMLVHDATGLMVSFRGALAFQNRLELPAKGVNPCTTCAAQPCKTACPVNALGPNGYNTKACHGYLETPPGQICRTQGCIARRACPISAGAQRDPDQSAHHMAYFHPKGKFE